MTIQDILLQAVLAFAYYAGILVLARIAGKRLAGQTTTFDLIVLIGLAVVAQNVTLREGVANSLVFIVVVLLTHRGLAVLCARVPRVRVLLRGRPRTLVREGEIIEVALREEGISHAELLAGLRKLGYAGPQEVRLAVLEETGHISAVANEPSSN